MAPGAEVMSSEKKDENSNKGNLWSSILNDVQNHGNQKLPSCKQVVVLGDNESGKTTLVAKLQGVEDPKKGSGLEYAYIDVRDDYRDDHTRLSVWVLDGDPGHTDLLKFALNNDTFPHSLVILTVTMTAPWGILEQLQNWASVLADHLDKLMIDIDVLQARRQHLVKMWQDYIEPGDELDPSSPMKRSSRNLGEGDDNEHEDSLPLPESTLLNNLGLDIVVVVTKTDYMQVLEKEHDYRDEYLDFMQQWIRRFCLQYGAALFYTSAKEDKNCDLLYKYLTHRIYGFPFRTPALVVEKDAIFIPAGWDNMKKIAILHENMHTCNPDDYYRDIIVPPVTRKTVSRESEILAEEEQSFLSRQQQILQAGGGLAPANPRSADAPMRGLGKVTRSPVAPSLQGSPNKKLDGPKVVSSPGDMVNTRRSESSGAAGDNGPRYQTRRSNDTLPVLRPFCESDSESQGAGEEADSIDEEDSWSLQEKEKVGDSKGDDPQLPPKVKEAASRFSCSERNFTKLHFRKRELRSTRQHLSVTERRHAIAVYSPHKMHDDLDSEEDCYSPRHHSRKTHYSKSHLARIERRTALSLRPITRKSYKDHSPGTCNSDDSTELKLRRSMRTRNSGDKNMSWLTDDQMHKIGYPNLRRRRYSDEDDARDMQNHHLNLRSHDQQKRKAHSHNSLKKKSKFMYNYETEEMHSNHDNMELSGGKMERTLRSTNRGAELHDKENKESNILNGKNNGRLRRIKAEPNVNIQQEESLDVSNFEEEARIPKGKGESGQVVQENGNIAEDEADEEEQENKPDEASTESEDNRPLRTRNSGKMDESRNRKMSESSSSSEVCVKGYSLRHRPPKQSTISLKSRPLRSRNIERNTIHARRRFNRRKISTGSSSSDSSDSDTGCRKKNGKYSKNSKPSHSKNEQLRSGAGGSKVIPIGPETLDPQVTFQSVGGLDAHVQCLKEMILLPMMYPEVFHRFQVQPPRGVLFHGPPGTGKTLLARALATECSFGSRKVSFFMRKGADLLSKWIGESEKQLTLLFEQASEMKPSIIFFDELDGLAPVRSSRQDQIHASIVSTLLALMDGLDSRGEVIVIGATNRIDAIDPALRRPGRFDRELYFPLPAEKEREEILRVHLSKWTTPPNNQLISYLAENSVGYCGSDLRALCSEAVIQSFRRTYPQVYTANYRLLLDPENVKVEKLDFLRAKSMLVPASHRVSQSVSRKLPAMLEPLLRKPLSNVMEFLEKSFPHGVNPNLAKVKLSAAMRPAQLLLLGDTFVHGHTTYLAPALLHRMEHVNTLILDLGALYSDCGRTPEETCIEVFREAKRNLPSLIYMPNIEILWNLVSETVISIFLSQILQIDPNSPILILATANCLYEELPEQLAGLFSKYRNEIYDIKLPSTEDRENFFKPLVIDACLKQPRLCRSRNKTPPPLPRAPTPPPPPLSKEDSKKLFEQEERTLRELRIFLRDMCKKLASNRLFFMFTKPVDTEEVPDYPTIIKCPMDLETMMTKVDFHRYECAKDFLEDIELICQNALEYNPARTSADKQIRHRACSLRDYAFALIKNEMDSDFEQKCQDIATKRKQRKASVKKYLPAYLDLQPSEEKPGTTEISSSKVSESKPVQNITHRVSPSRKRKIPSWQRGYLKKRKRRDRPILSESQQEDQIDERLSSGEESKENNPDALVVKNKIVAPLESNEECDIPEISPVTAELTVNCDITTSANVKDETSSLSSPAKRRLSDLLSPSELLNDPLDLDDIDQALNEVSCSTSENRTIDISQEELKEVLIKAVQVTAEHGLQSLLDLHFQLSRIVKKYIHTYSRKALPKELLNELVRFETENSF